MGEEDIWISPQMVNPLTSEEDGKRSAAMSLSVAENELDMPFLLLP